MSTKMRVVWRRTRATVLTLLALLPAAAVPFAAASPAQAAPGTFTVTATPLVTTVAAGDRIPVRLTYQCSGGDCLNAMAGALSGQYVWSGGYTSFGDLHAGDSGTVDVTLSTQARPIVKDLVTPNGATVSVSYEARANGIATTTSTFEVQATASVNVKVLSTGGPSTLAAGSQGHYQFLFFEHGLGLTNGVITIPVPAGATAKNLATSFNFSTTKQYLPGPDGTGGEIRLVPQDPTTFTSSTQMHDGTLDFDVVWPASAFPAGTSAQLVATWRGVPLGQTTETVVSATKTTNFVPLTPSARFTTVAPATCAPAGSADFYSKWSGSGSISNTSNGNLTGLTVRFTGIPDTVDPFTISGDGDPAVTKVTYTTYADPTPVTVTLAAFNAAPPARLATAEIVATGLQVAPNKTAGATLKATKNPPATSSTIAVAMIAVFADGSTLSGSADLAFQTCTIEAYQVDVVSNLSETQLGSETNFTARFTNTGSSTTVEPSVAMTLPPGVHLTDPARIVPIAPSPTVPGSTTVPITDVVVEPQADGSTLIRFHAVPGARLQPGGSAAWSIPVVVDPMISDTATVKAWGRNLLPVAPGTTVSPVRPGADTFDADKNGNTTELAATVNSRVYVTRTPAMKTTLGNQSPNDAVTAWAPAIDTAEPGVPYTHTIVVRNDTTVSYDHTIITEVLPFVGDVDPVSGAARGSAFAASYAGGLTLPAGATARWSASHNPCLPDRTPSVGCVDDWQPLDANTDPAAVRAITIDLGTTPMPPASMRTISWKMLTAPDAAGTAVHTALRTSRPVGSANLETVVTAPAGVRVVASALSLQKSASLVDADGDGKLDLGERVDYTFAVSNTGGTTVDNLTINDPMLAGRTPAATVSCDATRLAPGAATTCRASVTATQDDIDARTLANTATAVGANLAGVQVTSAAASATVTADARGAIDLAVAAQLADGDGDGLADAGEQVTFRYSLTNRGTIRIDTPRIQSSLFGGPATLNCPAVIEPGATVVCTSSPKTVTQADVDAGRVQDRATADGQLRGGGTVTTGEMTAEVRADDARQIALRKTATLVDGDGDALADLGERIDYSFAVSNTGNATLTGVSIRDPRLTARGVAVTCPAASLAPGASTTCTASVTVEQRDIDARSIMNDATAAATAPDGTAVQSAPSSASLAADAVAGIAFEKTAMLADADGDGLADVGEPIAYRFIVRNTGTMTASAPTIDDPMLAAAGISVQCPSGAIAPGASVECAASAGRLTSLDDVVAGEVVNRATASATVAGQATTASGTASVAADRRESLELVKTATIVDRDASGDAAATVGDAIDYRFEVRNTGTLPISGIIVDDPALAAQGIAVTCPRGELAAGETMSCSAQREVVAADLDRGSTLENVAAVQGSSVSGAAVTSEPSRADVALQAPDAGTSTPPAGGTPASPAAPDAGGSAPAGDGGGSGLVSTGAEPALPALLAAVLLAAGFLLTRRRTDGPSTTPRS